MADDQTCPIWGTPATCDPPHGEGRRIDSPRADGRYDLTGTAEELLKGWDAGLKARLTSWLIEQRGFGADCPRVSSYVLNSVKSRRLRSVRQRALQLLKYLADEEGAPGGGFLEPRPANRPFLLALAHVESIADEPDDKHRELNFFMTHLTQNGWIDEIPFAHSGSPLHGVTVEGYEIVDQLKQGLSNSSRAFVAMWFDKTMNAAYHDGIEPGIRDAGYEPVRVDGKEFLGRIDDAIIAEIRGCRFLVADFTQGNDGARGGVYYEAGFAHGLDTPVIFSCRKDGLDDVHFDTRQYNHIVWKEPADLREKLKLRILAAIGRGLLEDPA